VDIDYCEDRPQVAEVVALLRAAGLNGPLDEPDRVDRMIKHAQQLVVARRPGGELVGLVRVLTDFAFNAFVADLAVHPDYQRRGIGAELVRRVVEPYPGVKFVVHPGHDSGPFWGCHGFVAAPTCLVRMRAAAPGRTAG
jgi:predicted N-acetyltransferase YhbS